MKQEVKFLLMTVFVFSLITLTLSISLPSQQDTEVQSGIDSQVGINYKGDVCVTHKNADGEILMNECNHNVLFNTGAEAIETYLTDGRGTDGFDWIEVCDATNATCGNPQADSSEDWTAWTDSGLTGVAGTVGDNGNGNWNISTTFTSTADGVLTNVTHLTNDDDDEFAGNNFTLATLQTSDTLTVTWEITAA